jgi:hypothetical protein
MLRYLPLLALLAACGPTPPPGRSASQTYDTSNRIEKSAVRTGGQGSPGSGRGELRSGTVCYAGAVGADSIRLTVTHMGPAVKGELAYRPAEKDRSRGTLSGMMHGDTLLAHYTFQSEGTESVRQVAFLLRGDSALEGYGNMTERQNRQVFKDVRALHFGAGYRAVRTACR